MRLFIGDNNNMREKFGNVVELFLGFSPCSCFSSNPQTPLGTHPKRGKRDYLSTWLDTCNQGKGDKFTIELFLYNIQLHFWGLGKGNVRGEGHFKSFPLELKLNLLYPIWLYNLSIKTWPLSKNSKRSFELDCENMVTRLIMYVMLMLMFSSGKGCTLTIVLSLFD